MAPARPPQSSLPRADAARRRSRTPVVAAMLASLLASAGARQWADHVRNVDIPRRGESAAGTSLSSMNSFALGLLLGGLRGPLVMLLWTDSENKKAAKDLEGVDTEIEWIRLLQPEFDTVHLFQIWNKAYNISVQMASRANKYDAILSALDYASDVDRQKPEDINIVAAVGQIYFDKLGTSQEKFYYRRRVRDETKARPAADVRKPDAAGVARTRLDPILDADGRVLPALTKPTRTPAAENGETDDGSPMQYLPQFAPYADGVSTFAVSYNDYKRAEVLLNVLKQHHEQLSDMIVDSRPFLALRNWVEEASDQGRRHELTAFGKPTPDTGEEMDRQTQSLPPTQPVVDAGQMRLAIADYEQVAKITPATLAEYARHIRLYPQHDHLYRLYVDELKARDRMTAGDAAYLQAITAAPADRPAYAATAVAAYAEAERLNYVILLAYPDFVDPKYAEPALPPGYSLAAVGTGKSVYDLPLQQAAESYDRAERTRMAAKNAYVNHDRDDYEAGVRRARARLRQLGVGPATAPAGK